RSAGQMRTSVPSQLVSLLSDSPYFSTQDSDRSFGQGEDRFGTGRHRGGNRRVVRISMAVQPVVDPDILLAPKGHERDRSRERRALSGIVEHHAHAVRIV